MTEEENNLIDEVTLESFDQLHSLLVENIQDVNFLRVEQEGQLSPVELIVRVDKENINNFLMQLKSNSNLNFNYLRCLSGIDYATDGIEIVYQVYSINNLYNLTIKSKLSNDDLCIDSVTNVWKGANWYERETSEMFGVIFNNHPDPRNLLLPEDMTDVFPLRKSHPLAEIEVLQGEDIEPSGDI